MSLGTMKWTTLVELGHCRLVHHCWHTMFQGRTSAHNISHHLCCLQKTSEKQRNLIWHIHKLFVGKPERFSNASQRIYLINPSILYFLGKCPKWLSVLVLFHRNGDLVFLIFLSKKNKTMFFLLRKCCLAQDLLQFFLLFSQKVRK